VLPSGWSVRVTGLDELELGSHTQGPGVLTETLIGALGALLILAFVFGSLLALVPLLVAATSILTTFLIVFGLAELTQVSTYVEYLGALIGLGVAVDYSLLLVTRWREERASGHQGAHAIFPAMLAVIAVVTFLLLARAFKSILLPVKAVLLNLLSVGAAYGAMVLIWPDGHGSGLFGVPATGGGRLVTSAALVLVLAFASLASGPIITVKVVATGLGAGILLDATVLRALLVPALVGLFGAANWWWPGRKL